MNTTLQNLLDKLYGWGESFVLLLPNLLISILIVTGFWALAKTLRALLVKLLARVSQSRQINYLLGVLLYVIVLMTGVFFALGVLGLDKTLTSLLAGAGIIGLALGLAFQDMGANLLSGIYMSIERPFRTGHLIKSNDYFGTVERISLRQTEILTPEGQLVLIPNKKIFENPIVNFSASAHRRVDIAVGVSYSTDLDRAKEVAIAALRELPARDSSREVEMYYEEFGESAINFVARFWISFDRQPDFLRARSDAIEALKRAFDANEITIPFPTRTIEFSNSLRKTG